MFFFPFFRFLICTYFKRRVVPFVFHVGLCVIVLRDCVCLSIFPLLCQLSGCVCVPGRACLFSWLDDCMFVLFDKESVRLS